ncbi:MAG: ABC transporter permease subunit [Streptosporangiales bacterium]|nr:ABC transporter permease subunit [Streptosporangiales bacterium]
MKPREQLSSRLSTSVSRIVVAVFVAFLLVPVMLVIALSFSGTTFIQFPPKSWGWRQYSALVQSEYWLEAIRLSAIIAAATAIVSTVIALMACFAIFRTRMLGGQVLRVAGVTPLIIPVAAYGVALYGLFSRLDLIGSTVGLVVAHTLLSMPLAVVILGASMEQISPELEYVAMSLGASRARAWAGITMRLLAPAIGASLVFCFVSSFDEAVLVNFLGGGVLVTLPKAIFDSVRFGVDALITAAATLLIVATAGLMAVAGRWQKAVRRR